MDYYSIQKYSVDCLYAVSGNKLSTAYSSDSIETISSTLNPQQESVLAEFLSPIGFVMWPGMREIKLTIWATGQQSTKFCHFRPEILQNGVQVSIGNYRLLPESTQKLTTEIYLPEHAFTDRLTLRVWIRNSHTNGHSNTFYMQVNQNSSLIQK